MVSSPVAADHAARAKRRILIATSLVTTLIMLDSNIVAVSRGGWRGPSKPGRPAGGPARVSERQPPSHQIEGSACTADLSARKALALRSRSWGCMMMMFTVMTLGGARRLRRGRGGRGRVRCENAGLSDKAEDGSQKQNVFYHRLLLNTVKNAKFRKKLRHLAKERTGWSTTALTICASERSVPRNGSVDRYLLSVLENP